MDSILSFLCYGVKMNKEQELFTILMEECAEVTQIASKIIRFGDKDYHPDTGEGNIERLEKEIGDLLAMLGLVDEMGYINMEAVERAAEAKVVKLRKYSNLLK